MGNGVGVASGVALGVGVGVGLGVIDGLSLGLGVGLEDGVVLGAALGVCSGKGVGVAEADGTGDGICCNAVALREWAVVAVAIAIAAKRYLNMLPDRDGNSRADGLPLGVSRNDLDHIGLM